MATVEDILKAVRMLPPQEQVELTRQLNEIVIHRNRSAHLGTSSPNDTRARIQRALFDAGLISEIKPRTQRRSRRPPIKIKGKPLSETIIEDRR